MTKTMKATIVVTDETGTVWSGEIELSAGSATKPGRKKAKAKAVAAPSAHVGAEPTAADLKLPMRAFLRKFASNASGGGKFTMVVAHVAQGEVGKEIDGAEIEKEWNRNSGVLGAAFHHMYGTRAKEGGWVNSIKRGVFVLQAGWQKAANA